jgi:hypothetical protein
MPTQSVQPFEIIEEVTAEISWTFSDPDGNPIQNPALLTATITLYDVDSDTIINNRSDQDILGLDKTGNNNVEIVNGVATWYLQSDDNILITTHAAFELHIALIEWTWNPGDGNGVRQGRQEIKILVENLNHVS